jgi:ABC-type antimicrobial peptide transport system permease subunit
MHTIIGVVGDTRIEATQAEMPPTFYLVYPQLAWGALSVVARTSVAPMSLVPAIRAQVGGLDPDEPIYDVRTMDELVKRGMAQPRFQMILLGSFAAMALLLTLVGLYGVMSWSVARRTREIGVRMALGAPRPRVLRMVVGEALLLLAIGIGIGVAGSLAGARLLSALLFGVDPRSPQVLAVVCVLMILAGTLAALIPAWRAATIEPVEALRTE